MIYDRQYQSKLDSQSTKFKVNTEKTTNDANSQLIESYKNLEESKKEIQKLQQEIKALKSVKATNTEDQVTQFRFEKAQQKTKELEIQLRDKDLLSFLH